LSLLKKASSLADTPARRMGLIALSFLLMLIATWAALIMAPDAAGEPVTYRILYFHVPAAVLSYAGFFTVFGGSVLFLMNKDLRFDRWAAVGGELGVLFCALMLITGMIWGKQRWGAWWLWEPRLTTSLILLVIFVGYLILRGVVENEMTRARFAAVYGIIGFIDVPIVHFAIKIWGSVMHPVVIKSVRKPGMTPEMLMALRISFVAFIITFAVIYLIRLRATAVKTEIALCRSRAEEED